LERLKRTNGKTDLDHPAAPAREVRRTRGDQPPPGEPGHPRGGLHRHPGCRQGGLPPGRALPHPNENHGITPLTIVKPLKQLEVEVTDVKHVPQKEIPNLIIELEAKMQERPEILNGL
jgi:hypothetical protein